MGCEKAKCLICNKWIKGGGNFELILNEGKHLKEKHNKIHEMNKEAELTYQKAVQRALDRKLKNSHTPCFSPSKWDGGDYAD